MTRSELALDDLLVVEDDPAILEFRCGETGVVLWPLIRVVFIRMMMSDLLYSTPLVTVGTASTRLPWGRAIATLSRSILHNARFRVANRCSADICIMTDAMGTTLLDGKWFNRLSDYFALSCPSQTLVVEDHFDWKWPIPRHFGKVIFHAPRQAGNFVVGRMRVRDSHRRYAAKLVALVSLGAKARFGWDVGVHRQRQLTDMLARKLAGLPHQYRGYKAMLKHFRPTVLLIESACYGPSVALIAAARELKIVTAEFQHGAISSGHDAYNLAPSLQGCREYRLTLPDYFLGYGRWWIDQINVPVSKLAVGNPHRDAQLAQLGSLAVPKRDVLLLGDGIETSKYLSFAEQLALSLKGHCLRVVFRPHPIEWRLVHAKFPNGANGVSLDENVDIYQSLSAAHVVVSEQSTGLFEAIGLADKIFVWNTSKARFGFPSHPFQSIESAATLAEILQDTGAGKVSAGEADAIWAPHWRQNYLTFLQSCGLMLHEQ
jgi:hypothetical protein